MNEKQMKSFNKFFDEYVKSFYSKDLQIQKNIQLKENHTRRVVENNNIITKKMGLNKNSCFISNAIALFHDLGRFEQFVRFKTFFDLDSVNHAKLAVDILSEKNILNSISDEEQKIIKTAILNHNTRFLKEDMSDSELFFSKLIRDADKIDIFNTMIDYYNDRYIDENKDIALGMEDTAGFTKKNI